jgi:hypothetical protein
MYNEEKLNFKINVYGIVSRNYLRYIVRLSWKRLSSPLLLQSSPEPRERERERERESTVHRSGIDPHSTIRVEFIHFH